LVIEQLSAPLDEIASRAGAVDAEGRFPSEAMEALATAGLLAVGLPEERGGPGGGPLPFVELVEQVAGACGSTGIVLTMHVAATQTLLAGRRPGGPVDEALGEIAAGRHLTTLAYSERGSRSHFWAQVSRARRENGGVVIDADKSWATAAGHVDSYLIASGAPGETSPIATELYLVDARDPAIEIPSSYDGLGLRGNASAPLTVRNLCVPDPRRLGRPGSGLDLMLSATLPWFTLGAAACSVGLAGAAITAVTEHVSAARFVHLGGAALSELPTVRARLAEAKLRHMQARALLQQVAAQVSEGDPAATLGVLAIKASAAEMAIEVTDAAMRLGGGAAYSRQGPLERIFRDARAASVMAPTTDVLHDMVGKLLTGQELF
jgi:alkylation response protein AidB-like acyl-CoA dehydrogenase